MACFDGDGDRLIYFKRFEKYPMIITGDKIWCLIMMYIMEKIELLQSIDSITHCLYLTASANSQAFRWLGQNDVVFKKAPAGIRNARELVREYVVGAYAETNGHGIIYVDWERFNAALEGKEENINAKKLKALLKITNVHAYGDAIPTLLMLEAIMRDRDFNVTMLYNIYKDYPSLDINVKVDHKDKWITKWDQTELTDPSRFQDMI